MKNGQEGTIEEQEQNTTETLKSLVYLIREGYDLVLTHGNGPQVGNILMRSDAGRQQYGIPEMPVDICVADSQGGIGYMIERMLRNLLNKNGIRKEVVTLVTMSVVDRNDPALDQPTKRIGRVYNREEADRLAREKKWIFKEEVRVSNGWRRVVPSPTPVRIINEQVIENLARQGTIVIATGGGGVPVYIDERGDVRPAEAVIDKDLASSFMATGIGADEFYILTDVPFVCVNYRKPEEKAVEFLDHKDTMEYLERGEFAEGSMAPKIRACLQFIEKGGAKSVITEATKLYDRSFGTKITMEYED